MIIPILKLGDILISSLQRELEDREAAVFLQEVLQEIHRTNAYGLILDVKGMEVIDSYLARVLTEIATGASLMGARVVISGLRPEVAITLLEMGRSLLQAQTAIDLLGAMEILKPGIREFLLPPEPWELQS